ncbi:uncharacterized protein HKW66_Vig0046410 [Vigna angularis]|uniref:Uncharacterized protein n=1 Tax=Phaseolus angularis TaxID=3914 RepID=A0A8T0L068_PHAAN|nr:uncharacterized protein HKW66_Vig0046410 [Vigna angularis]
MSGIIHKIGETLHVGGHKKEEEHKGEHHGEHSEYKGEHHGEHKDDHHGVCDHSRRDDRAKSLRGRRRMRKNGLRQLQMQVCESVVRDSVFMRCRRSDTFSDERRREEKKNPKNPQTGTGVDNAGVPCGDLRDGAVVVGNSPPKGNNSTPDGPAATSFTGVEGLGAGWTGC